MNAFIHNLGNIFNFNFILQRSLALDGSRPGRSTSEILRKQSLAFFISLQLQHLKKEDPKKEYLKTRRYNLNPAAIGSSKQSSSINRRWAICYYILQYIHNTLLYNTHYNTLLPNTH
ncbi:hypothetical protein BLOT_012541 [Blomia tropicalis]|nr:hypothetical protein BLOT_012541 [Blomia tropicalis]